MEFYQKHDLEGRKHCGNNEWNILVSVDYSMRVMLRWCGIIINFHESKDEVFPLYRSSLCQSHFTELFNGWKEADDLNRMVHFVIIWSGNYYYAGVGRRNSEKWGNRFSLGHMKEDVIAKNEVQWEKVNYNGVSATVLCEFLGKVKL